MRTTITLPDGLIEQAMAVTGKRRLSDAVAASLDDYFRLKKRIALLDELFERPVPHRFRQIKAARKGRKWSS